MQNFTQAAFGRSEDLIDSVEATLRMHRMIAHEILADVRLAWEETTLTVARSHRLMSAVEESGTTGHWPPYNPDRIAQGYGKSQARRQEARSGR